MKKYMLIFITLLAMNFQVLSQDYRSVQLSWNSNQENDIAGYNVYRSEDGGVSFWQINHELIDHTGNGVETYIDQEAEIGATYFYTCRALNSSGLISERSNIVSITIEASKPLPPTGLTVVINE